MNTLIKSFIMTVAVSLSPSTFATIITFDGETPVFEIPEDYGSNISSASASFLEGNGFTANIAVSYSRDNGISNFSVWDGYSLLDNALGHTLYDVPGEIIFTAETGYGVILNSFDYAAWLGEYDARIQVFGDSDQVLFDSGMFTLNENQGIQSSTFSPLSSLSTLRIRFEDFGDLAIDNINFDQFALNPQVNVSEPGTLALLVLSMLAIVRINRRNFSLK